MLEQLVEHHIAGMGFQATESLFNVLLLLENRLSIHKHGIHFLSDAQEKPVSGHTYPIMYFYGVATSVIGHPVLEQLHQNFSSSVSYGLFGAMFACGAVAVEAAFGKIGYAPWREVYEYLEKRIAFSFEKGILSHVRSLKIIPATVSDKSACLWLLPAWLSFASLLPYVHDVYLRCKY
ncbi:MAG: hypothetical protein HY363_01235 [Candidatus Aenigmarchaeota archaeon]|nr:hypothetical protein [Candidatus Aenigmarchaeota archaeon]